MLKMYNKFIIFFFHSARKIKFKALHFQSAHSFQTPIKSTTHSSFIRHHKTPHHYYQLPQYLLLLPLLLLTSSKENIKLKGKKLHQATPANHVHKRGTKTLTSRSCCEQVRWLQTLVLVETDKKKVTSFFWFQFSRRIFSCAL